MSRIIFLGLLVAVLTGPGAYAYAFDGQPRGVSMHEVAVQIRQHKTWQILQASPKPRESGYSFFEFKVINKKGLIRVITVDPDNPNLRRLEQ